MGFPKVKCVFSIVLLTLLLLPTICDCSFVFMFVCFFAPISTFRFRRAQHTVSEPELLQRWWWWRGRIAHVDGRSSANEVDVHLSAEIADNGRRRRRPGRRRRRQRRRIRVQRSLHEPLPKYRSRGCGSCCKQE